MTGQTLTQVLEAALAAYCDQMAAATPTPLTAFTKAGFIGAGRGPKNLARDYKRRLGRSLGRKA